MRPPRDSSPETPPAAGPPPAGETHVELPQPLVASAAASIVRALGSLGPGGGPVRLEMERVREVDTFGLAAVASGIRALRARGREIRVAGLTPSVRRRAALLRFQEVLEAGPPPEPLSPGPLAHLRGKLVSLARSTIVVLAMLLEGLTSAARDTLLRPLGREHLARQVSRIGLGGVPIVAGVNTLVGAIMALQTSYVLELYGATLFVARGVGISMTRELGPLMAAVLLAGRSGSAIAAEIGAMVVSEETDALELMALSPRRFLLAPRFLALLVSVPALSVLADVCGIAGSALVMTFAYRIPLGVYLDETVTSIYVSDVSSGLLKSIVFGALIATVSCRHGLALRGGPESVGQAATSAVVHSITSVVLFDAAFTTATHGVL